MYERDIERTQTEISKHHVKMSEIGQKKVRAQSKANKALEAASKSKSATTARSKLREAEQANKEIVSLQKQESQCSKKLAELTARLHRLQRQKNQKDVDEQKRFEKEQASILRQLKSHQLEYGIKEKTKIPSPGEKTVDDPEYDLFISHASEDKEDFVRPLAAELSAKNASVWYDEFTLKVGDSLRRNIDKGLKNSRFGVVVLSEHFFNKEWTNKELDGLVAREVDGDTSILPIWHKVSKSEVAKFSPTIADKVALNSMQYTIEEIAEKLLEKIQK